MQCQAGESQVQPPLSSPRGPTKSQTLFSGGINNHASHQMDAGPSPQLPISQGLVDPVAVGGERVEEEQIRQKA